ncbi:MAG: putative metal-dependent hydrolase [Parvibaculaceae bacterium]|jgi:predicted metal-dependent hydrolase|nr:metal-dependent hydrolase [Parvibaculaceae bacterium]
MSQNAHVTPDDTDKMSLEGDPHPMTDIKVRPLVFDFDAILSGPVWSKSSPEFSIFINALGLHVPYFERYLIAALGKAKKEITDPELRKDVSAIIGQEAHHAKNYMAFNKYLATHYPKGGELDAHARKYFTEHMKTDDLKRLVGFTAGYETFTFLAGMIILDNYDAWLTDSDPVMKALWVWHQVEEVEHGAVAFEAYQHLYGEHEWYRKYMVVVTLLHILGETHKAFIHMIATEGYFRKPWKALKAYGFFWSVMSRMAILARPVFEKGYSPRRHPLVNKRQNPVAKAWRKFEGKGGAVAKIDRTKMEEIMAQGVAK